MLQIITFLVIAASSFIFGQTKHEKEKPVELFVNFKTEIKR